VHRTGATVAKKGRMCALPSSNQFECIGEMQLAVDQKQDENHQGSSGPKVHRADATMLRVFLGQAGRRSNGPKVHRTDATFGRWRYGKVSACSSRF